MTRKNTRTVVSLSALALVATAGLLFAGPLNPPAGPVTSTYKTLTEVEPRTAINATNTPGDNDATPSLFKITQPGSYYLTGNITGVVGKHGIEIAASGVTIDLNGFDLAGVPAMGLFDGVSVTVVSPTNIALLNGSVRNWGDEGVFLVPAKNCRVAGVLASGNAGIGIHTGDGSTVTNCSAYGNTSNGITTGSCCTVSNCSARENTGTGILVIPCCTVSNCAAEANGSSGIFTGAGCMVINCSAFSNGSIGISVNVTSTVADCTVRLNTLDGIACGSSCVIRGNTCSVNGSAGGDGAGIHATGGDNRIEGNNCISADRGIDVDAAGNIIIRNSCSGNTTNWVIAANNVYGPIVDRITPGSPAVNGNFAAGTLGNTDPHANVSY